MTQVIDETDKLELLKDFVSTNVWENQYIYVSYKSNGSVLFPKSIYLNSQFNFIDMPCYANKNSTSIDCSWVCLSGDFAVLLRAGMSLRKAIIYNIVSSVLCLVGMIIGVLLGNISSVTEWIFAAVGGMFLYIALVDMVSCFHLMKFFQFIDLLFIYIDMPKVMGEVPSII